DIRAVLDAVGSRQAILYGISESGPMVIYFAASHPERVRALVLYGTFARTEPVSAEAMREYLDDLERNWGTGRAYGMFLSHAPDPAAAERVLARYERSACTPQMCREIIATQLPDRRVAHAVHRRRPDARDALQPRPGGAGRVRPVPRRAHPGR